MLEPRGSRFYQAALQSGLIDEAGLDACWVLIPDAKRTPDAIDRRLARRAITAGKLTLWQAQQLLAGRSTGYKIDKYVLLDLLGRGGMGRVYLARDVRLGRLVALKILSQERMNNPRALARFRREAKVGAQLQHENLVRIYDEGESGGIHYLVMEYIEGKNVGHLIGELGSIRWPIAARLARQVALGLDHARIKELIHRDVNPCNILVTQDGTAKLADLGLAIDLNDTDNVTRDGATVGTFDYVSPEQARHSRSVDTRADIYSLGCTIFHMIAGRVPFPVASLPEKLYAHQLHDPEPLDALVPGVPGGLAEVVRRMMRKRPEERYQTPAEVAQALEPFAVESGWTATPAASRRGPGPSAAAGAITAITPGAASPRPSGDAVGTGSGSEGGPAGAEAPFSWAAALGSNAASSGQVPPAAVGGGGAGSSGPRVPAGVGDSFLDVDLGPDEPLGEGLKSGLKPRPSAPAGRNRRAIVIAGAAAAALIALATVVTLASMSLSGPGTLGLGKSGGSKVAGAGAGPPPPLARGDVVVRYRNGASERAESLPDAIEKAVSDGGEIILAGGTTTRLSSENPIRIPNGGLTIRAVAGGKATLEVSIKGPLPRPMFVIDANIRLVDLAVEVRYETPSDSPVFQAERDLTLERCAFRATGPTDRSLLILAEGRTIEVSGCLFQGFDCALEISAWPRMSARLKQSIFLSPAGGEEATGRAVRVRSLLGGDGVCNLDVADCSARTGSFLEAANFRDASSITVGIARSALLVKALVEFDEFTRVGPSAAVHWEGAGNRYHVTVAGGTWACLLGLEKLPEGPTDLEAWSKIAKESGSLARPLKLAKDPPDPANPADYALITEDGKPIGADPKQVGPGNANPGPGVGRPRDGR